MPSYRYSFISHAHADKALCDPYADALARLGASHYYDRENPQIGHSLSLALQEELQKANVLIVMVSPASLNSFWVNEEIGMFMALMAKDRLRKLIPVKIASCDLPARLDHRGWLDATFLTHDEVVTQLASALELRPLQTLAPTHENRVDSSANTSFSSTNQSLLPADYDFPDTELLIAFDPPGIPYHSVQLNVHKEYSLDLDDYLNHELQIYNMHRVSRGLLPYYPGVVYRVLRPPMLIHDNGKRLQVDLSTLNFAYYALLRADSVPSNVKAYIVNCIDRIANQIPNELSSNHSHINSYNATPMGMMIVLITQDGYTLLRRRGRSVLDGPTEWETSFGGYCEVENVEQDVLKIEKVAEMELGDELAWTLPRNPNKLRFTGVCRNNRTSAIDILGYWKLDATAKQIIDVINIKHPNEITRVFETTQKADEEFVHDTHNLIVKCNTSVIEQALQQAGIGGKSFIPEARIALDLALRCKGERYLRLES